MLTLLNTLIPSIIAPIITQILKNHPSIPLSEGQKIRLRAACVAFSGLITLTMASIDGSLGSMDLPTIVLSIITNSLGAFGIYHLMPAPTETN